MIKKMKAKIFKYCGKDNIMHLIIKKKLFNKSTIFDKFTIFNLISNFDFTEIVLIFDMEKCEEFLNVFENECIKYVIKKSSNKVSEAIVLISKNQLLDALDFILSKETDDFFMYVMNEGVTWEYFLANSRDLCYENKIYKLVNLEMDISLSECEITLSYNTIIYNDKNIIKNVKKQLYL